MLDPRRPLSTLQLRSLRIFCDVVRLRSFSAAAGEHGVSQGAASQAVQHVEEMLDVPLLDRSTRPFTVTPEGQRFFEGVCDLLRNFDTLIDEVRGKSEEVTGYVAVGAIYSIGLSYLPQVEEQFAQRYPAASLKRMLDHPMEIYRAVEQGTIDIGLVSYPQSDKAVVATPLLEEPMVLVASPRHRLASRPQIAASELSQVGLVTFASDLPIRLAIDRALRSVGVAMRIVHELDNIDSVKHAVTVNSGLGFLPELTVQQELAAGSLKLLNCPEISLKRPIGFLQRRDKPLTRAARELVELLSELAKIPAGAPAGEGTLPQGGRVAARAAKSRRKHPGGKSAPPIEASASE